MTNLAELLNPISPEDPCGVDLSYDPAMQELETVLQGKPETQFSVAEEPNWEDVRERCIALLQRSKNLRIAVILCVALLRTQGLPGFRDGLALIQGLLEAYWESMYPRLDPEDGNDPTERVNILASLVTPLGSFDDPMQFLKRLREAKLTDSARVGRFSMEEIAPSAKPGEAGAAPGVDPGQVRAAFRDTPPEKLERVVSAVADATASAKAVDSLLTQTIGAGRAPDWGPLLATLGDLRKMLAGYVSGLVETSGAAEEGGGTASSAMDVSGGAVVAPGTIQTRQDVIRTLGKLCEYYIRAEPSSPVPLLLQRAQRLAEMNFLEIIGDLSPDALGPLHYVTGTKPPPTPEA